MSTRRERERRKKLRRIRNAISAAFCVLILLLVLGIVNLLTGVLEKHLPIIDGNGDYTISILEKLSGDKEEKEPDKKGLTVCIDAGHGGKDNGSDYKNRYEKDDTLALALAVQSYLQEKDVNVIMTRSDDTFLKLSERCDIANEAEADYYVSLHRNTGEGYGVETWVYSGANEETMGLAGNIQQGLAGVGVQRDRDVKKGTQKSSSKDYYVNSHSHMPSCIVEMGFMNNAKDNQLFDDNKEAYAAAIGDAIIATYETYHGDGTGGNTETDTSIGDTTTGDADTDGTSGSTEDSTATEDTKNVGEVITNQQIANVEALDGTCQNWGQGVNFDEENRPIGAVSYQEKYGDYQANFIGADEKKIYLTFDEGYEYGCTPQILDTLKEKGVKATFFVTEPYAKAQPELVQRMIDEGHEIGNHSVTHPSEGLPSQSLEQQKNEVMENHQYIKDNFGYDMHLFRFPAGKFSDQSLAVVNNCNYKSVFWSFAYKDYDVNNQPGESEALQKLKDRMHPGAIYLLHAESTTNTAILGRFIDAAQAAGYEVVAFQ